MFQSCIHDLKVFSEKPEPTCMMDQTPGGTSEPKDAAWVQAERSSSSHRLSLVT